MSAVNIQASSIDTRQGMLFARITRSTDVPPRDVHLHQTSDVPHPCRQLTALSQRVARLDYMNQSTIMFMISVMFTLY
jgi:hypothetical protein